MNIAALERDLEKKQADARAMFEKTAKQAEAEDREFTAEERAAVETLLAEAKTIKTKLDRFKADASMRDQIDQLLGQERSRASAADPSVGRRSGVRVTLGQQFVDSDVYKAFRNQAKAVRGARWSTGVVELQSELLDSDAGSPGSGGESDRPGLSTGHSAITVPPTGCGGSHRARHDRLKRDHLHARNDVRQQRRYGRGGRSSNRNPDCASSRCPIVSTRSRTGCP